MTQTQMWARVEDGHVVELIELETDLKPGRDLYHPDLQFVPADGATRIGQRVVDGKIVA